MKQPWDGTGRPEAPINATVREKAEWSEIVNSFPENHFEPSDLHTILDLARARAATHAISANIENTELLEDVRKLMAMRDRESRRAAWLVQKLQTR